MISSNKGYSLVEIGVGILILSVFLMCSMALFNGCYHNYRMIQQRNIAIDYAVSNMEKVLQTDSNILTGFFKEELNEEKNKYELKANVDFKNFVKTNFETKFKQRYADFKKIKLENVVSPNDLEYEEFIYADRDFLIASYIQNEVNEYSLAERESEKIKSGNYGFLIPNKTIEGDLISPTNVNRMKIETTINRLPIQKGEFAFDNHVLKVKVKVFYTTRINNTGITDKDIKSIELNSVKVSNF